MTENYGKVASGMRCTNGQWTHRRNTTPDECFDIVLNDDDCSSKYFSWSVKDGHCWCVKVGMKCTSGAGCWYGRKITDCSDPHELTEQRYMLTYEKILGKNVLFYPPFGSNKIFGRYFKILELTSNVSNK